MIPSALCSESLSIDPIETLGSHSRTTAGRLKGPGILPLSEGEWRGGGELEDTGSTPKEGTIPSAGVGLCARSHDPEFSRESRNLDFHVNLPTLKWWQRIQN